MSQEERSGKVSWNFAAEQARFIFLQLVDANRHYKNGDMWNYFICFTGIRDNLHHEFTEEEKTDLDILEKKCRDTYPFWQKYVLSKSMLIKLPKEILEKKKLFTENVRAYHRRIMVCLKRMGFMPDKEDRTRLKF